MALVLGLQRGTINYISYLINKINFFLKCYLSGAIHVSKVSIYKTYILPFFYYIIQKCRI